MGDIEEYPFSFMNTPASLQLLASSKVALTVLQYKYSNLNGNDISFGLFLDQTFSCDEILVIPIRFKPEIDNKIVRIRQELKSWIEFHRTFKLIDADSRGDSYTLFNCLKHVVVDAFGRIDYKATTVNILNSGDLSDDLVSYRMACTYCLEDQIKLIWPSVAEDVRLNRIANPNHCEYKYDLVYYWTRRMKSSDDSIHADFSVLRMLYRVMPSWPAFEYFWKLLPDEQRIPVVIDSLRNGSYRITKISLPTLNRIQSEKVFLDATSDLLDFLVLPESDEDYLPHMYQLWTAMKNKVLYKKACFSVFVKTLWRAMAFLPSEIAKGWTGFATGTSDTGGRRPNYARCDQINDVLLQFWFSADDELKDYVVSNNRFTDIRYFFDRLDACSGYVFCYYGHDAIFMSDLLKRSKNLDKEQFWREYWHTLALLVKPSCLERLMRLCLPNDDAIEIFKNQLAGFKKLFRSLIEEGFYSHLKDYLVFCSKDAKQFQWLAKDMLESNLHVILLHDDVKFADFDWFVDELFSYVGKDVDEFKAQIISSPEGLKCLFSARHADDGTRSNDFGGIISRFASNERQLNLVKSKLWAAWKWQMETDYVDQFYADQWGSFLEWCAVNSEELTAFKSSLNLDRVFVVRLSQYFDGEEDFWANEVLEFLDAFLKWYFANEKDAKNFKLDIIKNYKRIDVFCAKLESNDERDRRLMTELFRWFLRW